MREATKSELADSIGHRCLSDERNDTESTFTVFDGGPLLHRIQWKRGSTFDDICKQYVSFIEQSVGPVVVFHGYDIRPSTKDCTHQGRARGVVGPKVSGFSGNRVLMTTKERFLSNKTNENSFIVLKQHLESQGIETKQASGEADCLISRAGVDLSAVGFTFVIGEDTDLVDFLCVIAPITLAHPRSVFT